MPGSTAAKHIIAIGASAGGLEALEQFFCHNPLPDSVCYIVIQHLSPTHKSMMAELLVRYTPIPIRLIEDGAQLHANTIYLIPPAASVTVENGQFQLRQRQHDVLPLPIDTLLTSLAHHHATHTVAVILSGTGSDGSRGIRELKHAGGNVLVQAPEDARFGGMPDSAIATHCVDCIAGASELASRAAQYLQPDEPVAAPDTTDKTENDILALMLERTGVDFRQYKHSTVSRRLQRRYNATHRPEPGRYYPYLLDHPDEQRILYDDLLIPVTSFFRDGAVFDYLAEHVLPELLKDTQQQLRVWVAGCSSGEEAYSLAMLIEETLQRSANSAAWKLFATDVNDRNVQRASMGVYPHSIAEEISRERLQRFFIATSNGYQIRAELREHIVFARHNLLSDPPFTRMDLVACRNTLIYLQPEAQARVLAGFRHALQPHGVLLLGNSESTQGMDDSYRCLNDNLSLYQRTGGHMSAMTSSSRPRSRARQAALRSRPASASLPSPSPSESSKAAPMLELLKQSLIQRYAPPTLVIDADSRDVKRTLANVTPFLTTFDGPVSTHITDLIAKPLLPTVQSLLLRCRTQNDECRSATMSYTIAGQDMQLQLVAYPLEQDSNLLAVSFIDQQHAEASPNNAIVDDDYVHALEQELTQTQHDLKATIEELETTNEELQAANEELMASNEELQSSNEELQSVNEELNTVNAEYQSKVAQLNQLNADLTTMISASGVATVFVNNELRVTRFSPDIAEVFRLRESDIGRPLEEMHNHTDYTTVIDDLRRAIDQQQPVERELITAQQRVLLARITPYSEPRLQLRGAVATFIDITDVQRAQQLQAVIDALPEHIALIKYDGEIAMVNRAWARFASLNGNPDCRSCGVGSNYLSAMETAIAASDGDDHALLAIRDGIKGVILGTRNGYFVQYPCHSATEQRWFLMSVAPVANHDYAAVVSHFNITEWYRDDRTRTAQ
ncbi:chemotaxis protein CheR [Bacterioplanes sanyensis]|uniref:protein-glutamate O-methyltransferase n=1 Tax=Bacterioplanes sanyensis TaxID=1249553 RepID=A0A222FMN0_9GAMM|nr:CheR family methyltransferase [Bacterioplanes sanyensis]ASP40030.1 chemotaxis protein CheR [Bacterioplanes sanyensis]